MGNVFTLITEKNCDVIGLGSGFGLKNAADKGLSQTAKKEKGKNGNLF